MSRKGVWILLRGFCSGCKSSKWRGNCSKMAPEVKSTKSTAIGASPPIDWSSQGNSPISNQVASQYQRPRERTGKLLQYPVINWSTFRIRIIQIETFIKRYILQNIDSVSVISESSLKDKAKVLINSLIELFIMLMGHIISPNPLKYFSEHFSSPKVTIDRDNWAKMPWTKYPNLSLN